MEKVTNILLEDGKRYSGYGYYSGSTFVPNGYGKKDFQSMYAKGNFVNGILDGPAIISHDYYMYTMQMKNDRGNGWGLCINGGTLVEFGYYKDSQLVVDLLDAVEWYYAKMEDSDRAGENMLHIYSSKLDGSLTHLHIGYSPQDMGGGVGLAGMGFHFMSDGSVWVGTNSSNKLDGSLIKFCSDGYIQIGRFENGTLVEKMDIQELIDQYYGTFKFDEDDIFASMFRSRTKSATQLAREEKRKEFDHVRIDTDRNYFKLEGDSADSDEFFGLDDDIDLNDIVVDEPNTQPQENVSGNPVRPDGVTITREIQNTGYKAYEICPDYQSKHRTFHFSPITRPRGYDIYNYVCKEDCLCPTCPFYSKWAVASYANDHWTDYDEWIVEAYKTLK